MDDNKFTPPAATVADVAPAPARLTWALVRTIWWSFIWRSALYGFFGGMLLGAVAGAIAGGSGHLDKARAAGGVAGYLAGILCSLPALKQALEKHWHRLTSVRD